MTKNKAGFTLLELIITISLLAILAVVAAGSYIGYQRTFELESAARDIVDNLRDAQGRAMASENNLNWGIHFENNISGGPFYSRFSGSSYITSDETFYLPSSIQFNTPTTGNSLDIIFNKLKGTIASDLSIIISLTASSSDTRTISVNKAGKITSN
jgi:prepilin-type N-terminal cleavage/methylation domain-containing protein